MKYLLILLFIFNIESCFAKDEIIYAVVKNKQLVNINFSEFEMCERIIYRDIGTKHLPLKYKKKLLKAIIKAETINNLENIKEKEKSCTFYLNSEIND